MSTTIRFNGREYASVDEMPPDDRRSYELAIERIRSSLADGNSAGAPASRTSAWSSGNGLVQTRVVVTHQTYKRPADLPPDLHREYDEATRQDGIATKPHAGFSIQLVSSRDSATHAATREASPPVDASGAIGPSPIRDESTVGRTLLAALAAIVIGAVAWFLFGSRLVGPR